jgi:hypothetical protein
MANIVSFDLAIFLVGTLAAAFVTGLAGFAFGIVAAGIWLYALTLSQTSALIVAYGLLGWAPSEAASCHPAASARALIVGSAIGSGRKAALRGFPVRFRIGVGVLLIVFSLLNLVRPELPEMKAAAAARMPRSAFFNGALGAPPGWAASFRRFGGLRRWPRDEQRAVFSQLYRDFSITIGPRRRRHHG